MKITAYHSNGNVMIGSVDRNGDVTAIAPIDKFWSNPAAAIKSAEAKPVGNIATLKQLPAVPRSARVICIGLNYRLHAMETNSPIPEVPVVFSRWTSSLSVDGDPAPAVEEKFDWEAELAVVIGRRMFRVSEEQAAEGIFGYAAFNDLSARSFQTQSPQWTMGKNSDASGPMSAIATADEVGNPADGLRISTTVNGKTVQDSTTADMIFMPPALIAHISQVMTLEPGDMIISGTPSGVGVALGHFLKPGDVVEVEIERVGKVTTPIVACGDTIFE